MTSPLVTLDMIAGRQSVRRKQGALHVADIGKDNGEIYVKNNPGYIWVRDALGVDATTGDTTYGQAYQARSQKSHLVGYGIRVRVRYDEFDDEWEIDRTDFQTLVDQGINPSIENPSNPYSKQYDMKSLPPLLTYAVSTGLTPTTEVSVMNLVYLDYLGDVKSFQLPNASRPDIGDNEPATGLKRLVHLWLNHDNTVTQTVSTPISVSDDFSIATDLAEAMEAPPNNLALPIGAWKIENGQTSINPDDLYMDTRQWINQPTAPGLPNPITKNYIIPTGMEANHAGVLSTTGGVLTVQGVLTTDSSPDPVQVWRDFPPSSYTLNTGSLASGTITDAQVMYDGNELVIDEATGVPGYDIEFIFTGIDRFPNMVVARWQYNGAANHFVTIDAYNYNTTAWDQVRAFSNSNAFFASMTMYTPLANQVDYVDSSGNAKLRFYHQTTGNEAHDIHIDYVGLTHGVHL